MKENEKKEMIDRIAGTLQRNGFTAVQTQVINIMKNSRRKDSK